MKRIILICVFFTVSLSVASAQQSLTMEQYCQQVIAYSNTLKQSKQTLDYAESNIKLYRADYLPSLSLSASADYMIDHPTQSSAVKDFNYLSSLTLSQTIYDGGTVRNNSKIAQIDKLLAEVGVESSEIEILYQAQITYWALAAADQQLSIAEDYLNIVDSLYKIVEVRFSDGYVARTDLLMVETQRNQAQFSKAEAYKYYLEALISLNILIGNQQMENYKLTSALENIEALDGLISTGYNIEEHPYFRSAVLNSQRGLSNIKLARSAYNPTFSIGVQGTLGTLSPNFNMDSYLWAAAYATLSIPIFDWGSRRHSVAKARASSNIANLELQQTADNLSNYYSTALSDVVRGFEQVKISEKNLSVAQESLDLQTFSYTEGKLPIIYILQAQITWLQAYNDYVTSSYNYQTAVSRYRLYTAAV